MERTRGVRGGGAVMVVERQGYMECGLATIGALAGRPLADVRHIAIEESARAGRPFYRHTVLACIARRVGGDSLVALTGFDWAPWSPLESTGGVRVLGPLTRKLPARGRGVVRVQLRRDYTQGHVMPWADGLIYNPNDPERPLTLAQYRREHGGRWKVTYITHTTSLDIGRRVGYDVDHGADAPTSE